MTQKKRIQWIWAVVAGAILGTAVGHVIGIYIHSDNLPFFDTLGAAIGIGIGFMLFFAATGGMLGIAAQAGSTWTISAVVLFVIMGALAFVQRRITGM